MKQRERDIYIYLFYSLQTSSSDGVVLPAANAFGQADPIQKTELCGPVPEPGV
jgi:hypothetical protein